MQTFFHIGPAKTGTSSVQFVLKQRYGADAPQPVWYPLRDFVGGTAGQNRLAGRFRQLPHLYAPQEGLELIRQVVSEALSAGVERLLVSAENFSFASPEDMQKIRAEFPADGFHLIITANPLAKRLVSQWSTKLLNGYQGRVEDAIELLPELPGLSPDYYSNAISSLSPDTTTLICIPTGAPPEELLQTYLSVCGLEGEPLSEREAQPKNISLDYFQSELMIRFSELFEESAQSQPDLTESVVPLFQRPEYQNLRKQVIKLFRNPAWTEGMAFRRVEFPESARPAMRSLAERQRADIRELTDAGKLKVIGDTDALFADLLS